MRRFVLILSTWLGVIVVAVVLMDAHINKGRHRFAITANEQQRFTRQIALLRAVEDRYQQQHYPEALALLESQKALFKQQPLPNQLALAYYLLKGKLHWSLWEYVEAEQAWQAAQQYARTTQQQGMLARLTRDSQRVINDINRERNKREVYLASPHVGPAGELRGRIALIYIFLVDGGGKTWSLRDRGFVQTTWQSAQTWLQARAGQYGGSIRFVQRTFLIDRNPQIKRLRVGDVNNKFKNVDTVVALVARQLGYRDLLTFTEQIKRQEHADEAMLLLHLARDGRSFASRCMHRCSEQGEFAVLLESPRAKKWQSLQYAQAHESLHLFGADDLYNIRGAKYFDVRDIMNYPSSRLQASSLDTLTAWAIGLEPRRPVTPFQIKTYN